MVKRKSVSLLFCHTHMWVVTLHNLLCTRTHPNPVTLLPNGSGYFRAKPFPVSIPQHFSNLVILHLPAYEDRTECSETSAYKIQTPGNYPEESIQQFIPVCSRLIVQKISVNLRILKLPVSRQKLKYKRHKTL